MNSPSIAIVSSYLANNTDIEKAQAELKSPAQVKDFIDATPNSTGYEIVPDDKSIRPYFDWDYELKGEDITNYEEMKHKVYIEALANVIEMGFPQDNIYWSSRHGRNQNGDLKVSWRATAVGMKTTKETMKKVTQAFRDKHYNIYLQQQNDRSLANKKSFKSTPKGWLDIGVYSSNRKMGLVGCIKKYPEDARRLTQHGEYPHHYTLIACVDENDTTYAPADVFDTSSRDAVVDETSSQSSYTNNIIDGQDYLAELVDKGFTQIQFRNEYEFRCRQMDEGVECPLCGGDHTSNHYFIYPDVEDNVWVKNFSETCEPRKIRERLTGFLFDGLDSVSQVETEIEEDDYTIKKQHFEENRQVAMIEKGLVYIVDDEHYLTKKELIETFQDFLVKGNKRDKPFTDEWLRDPNKRKYKRMDFLPQGSPPDVYNLWRGYNIDSVECEAGGDVSPFKRLLEALTDSKEGDAEYDYLLKWIALMFQKPYKKTLVAVVIKSEEGIGKNTLFWYIGEKLMGNNLYKETNQPEHDLFAEHTNAMERRKLVVLDEADVFKYHSKICPLITNMETRVRKMYMNPTEISNYAQIAILTNNSVPVKISPSDRRYVVFDGNTSLKGDRDFWTHFYDVWAIDPVHQKAVHDYLLNVDLTGFDFWRERPITEAYREIRSASLPSEIKFLVHFIIDAYPVTLQPPGSSIKGYDLYRIYDRYSPSANETNNPARFGTRLRNFLRTKGKYSEGSQERNIFHKSRGADGVGWSIDRTRAFDWLRDENFTSVETLPEAISYQNYGGDFNPNRITQTF